MSAAPSEPEKYSIDEMMDRLKSAPSDNPGEGELVTRSDGSQAMRVRKRKRRSTQPHKEEVQRTRRSRIIQVSAALVLVVVAAVVIGTAVIYANSSPFRNNLIENIGRTSGATVDLQTFRMNPKTANAGRLSLDWPDGNVLKNLTLNSVNAEIFPSSFLGKSFSGEEINFNSGSLTLQIPKAGQSVTNTSEKKENSGINFNRYRVRLFDITLGEKKAPVFSLTKAEASLTPVNGNSRPQLALFQGNLAIPGWPKLRLHRANIEFRGEDTEIQRFSVLHEKDDRGLLEFSGTISPYKPQQPATLAVALESFELSGIIGEGLAGIFTGRVDSLPVTKSNYFSFLPSENPQPKLDIAFHAAATSRIEVYKFPFLAETAEMLEYSWLQKPVFDTEASGFIHSESGIVSLREIKFESKGHMALTGEISAAVDQSLSGNLRVGIAESIVTASKDARLKALFSAPEDGFRWFTLKIGGTVASPKDNFKDLLSAARSASPSSAPAEEYKGSTFEQLTTPSK